MTRSGPLIPGLREYDAPRRRRRSGPWWWLGLGLAALAGLIAVAGMVGGVGPLGALGRVETPLQPVAWRPTGQADVIQVAVAIPPAGLCAGDEIHAVGVERGPRIEVSATRSQPRTRDTCSGVGIAGDRSWVDVALDAPLGERTVLRLEDRQPLPKEPPG